MAITLLHTGRIRLRHVSQTICLAICVMVVSVRAAADPIHPQCWVCLQRLARELPAVNPQEDPSYEQGLTPGSVLPALANCSLEDGEIPTLQQIIKVFTDAQIADGGAAYVREHLASLPKVSAEDRVKLVDGATKDLDTTLRHLVDHNCRLLLQSHFDEGASRKWVLQMIEIGQESRENSLSILLIALDTPGPALAASAGNRCITPVTIGESIGSGGKQEGGDQPLDIPLPRRRQCLVEIVNIQDQTGVPASRSRRNLAGERHRVPGCGWR